MVGVPCQKEGAGRTEAMVSVWGTETAALRGCSDPAKERRGGRGPDAGFKEPKARLLGKWCTWIVKLRKRV